MRIPKHIGIIPDGNRRWAVQNNMTKDRGYENGLLPGLKAFEHCQQLGVKELSIYGFTMDNTKRPSKQRLAFTNACVKMVEMLKTKNVELFVAGNTETPMFPKELLPLTTPTAFGDDENRLRVNLLINYSPQWDISGQKTKNNISRIDLIIRWGGMYRLSGFLPMQSVYSDIYVVKDFWPQYNDSHIDDAIGWYQLQDVTLGG